MVEENQEIFDNLRCNFFKYNDSEKHFSLIYANIRSMRKNFNSFLAEFLLIKENIDIIVLTEVWISSDEVDFYKISGYNSFASCNDNYRAGGVVCFLNDKFKATKVQLNLTTVDTLLLEVKCKNYFFNLLCLYRLQNFSEKQFIDQIHDVMPNIKNNTVFIGDININLLDSNSLHVQNYQNLMGNSGFLSLNNLPTRISATSKSCLDHIFVKSRHIEVFKSAVFDLNLTDHCLLGLVMVNKNCNSIIKKGNDIKLQTKVVLDYELINEKLSKVDWTELFLLHDVNSCYDQFHNILSSIVNSSSRQIEIRCKLDKAKCVSPWITSSILKKIERRRKLFKISKRRPYDNAFGTFFKNFCSNLQKEIDTTKNNYYSNKILECKGDTAQQWKIINNLTGSAKQKVLNTVELEDGTVITEPNVAANEINKYLVSVNSSADLNLINTQNTRNQTHILNSLFFYQVTEYELQTIVNSLKNKKSCGFDKFNVVLIKEVSKNIVPILTYIINLSLATGTFPDKLKTSIVVPIPKKEKSTNITNLRPISLLSVFSKIIEKCVKVRLLNYINKLAIISTKQFGFTKGKSTEDALLNVSDSILTNLNLNNKVTGLYLDFKKAFDFVHHEILLEKLSALGVRGVALDWFRSYLTGRSQRVRVGDSLSPPLPIASGVPQGAVLSANLFLIFINDLLTENLHGTINAFADDVALFYFQNNSDLILRNINEDLKMIRKWCSRNKMEINVSKTKYINFDLKGFDLPNRIFYHEEHCGLDCNSCQVIERVDNFKYLGLVMDEKMKWEAHINSIHKKIKFSIRQFYFLKNFCDQKLLRCLYFALVQSKIQYGLTCWGNTFKYLINKIRISQNHIMRIVLQKRKIESSFPLFFQLKILPVQHLFTYKVLRLFYIRSGNQGTTNLYYRTRSLTNNKFRVPKVNKSIYRQSFSYIAPKLFNQIPPKIKEHNNIKKFSRVLYSWLLDNENIYFLCNVAV